jgi:HEAT repeat protein
MDQTLHKEATMQVLHACLAVLQMIFTVVPAREVAAATQDLLVSQAPPIASGAELGPKARSTVPALLRSLADDAPSIRIGAAEALAAIGDRAVIPALEGLLEDKDDFVREAARASLEKLGVAQQ